MPNDKEVELEFPLSGIDITTEFQEQKPGTTPEAINVRAFDPIARRSRGGSRPGLAHYAPDPVPANAAIDMTIQHLAVIVDPHATALPQNFVTPGDDWVADPLNPGTVVPPGGWAPSGGPPAPTANIQFVQDTADVSNDIDTLPSGVMTLTLTTPVAAGQLVVVAVETAQFDELDNQGDVGVSLLVKNGSGSAFTQIGTYATISSSGLGPDAFYFRMSVWYKIATGSADGTIKITPSPTTTGGEVNDIISMRASALNWRNTHLTLPFVATSKASTASEVTTLASGNVATTTGGMLFVACGGGYEAYAQDVTMTPTMTVRTGSGQQLQVFDKFPMNGAGDNPTNPSAGTPGVAGQIMVIAATFRKTP